MKRKIKIIYCSGHSGESMKEGEFCYRLIFDDQTRRDIKIFTKNETIKQSLFNSCKMERLMKYLIKKSEWSQVMSYSDFMNLEFKEFPGFRIENKLII